MFKSEAGNLFTFSAVTHQWIQFDFELRRNSGNSDVDPLELNEF
jgi:hypothetical protein